MRRLAFRVLRWTGLPFLLRELVQYRRVSILCYHDPRPDDFARHLETLARHYSIISLRRFLDWRRRSDITLPPKALVITFDDGHRNNFQLRDVLRRFDVSATIFLCSAIVGTKRHFWWTKAPSSRIAGLKQLSDRERRAALRAGGFVETNEYGERQALSGEEIFRLRPFVDFQSHTRFHPILPQCDDVRAADEIRNSKRELESRFGLHVYALAYPNGDYSARDAELARHAGYECALTIDGGYNTRTTDAFRLRRIPMHDAASRDELIVKASGLWGLWERRRKAAQAREERMGTGTGTGHVGANIR